MVFASMARMWSFTNYFRVGKWSFESLHITKQWNQGDSTTDRALCPFVMKRTKSSMNRSCGGSSFLSLPQPPKYYVMVDGYTCHFLFFSLPSQTSPSVDSNLILYLTKSSKCSLDKCFYINILPWLGLYWTRPFQNLVVLWELCISSTWGKEPMWQMMHFIILNASSALLGH